MATEIEHKYLIKIKLWENIVPEKSEEIKQAYLLTDPNKTIRIRTKGYKAYITIKGKTIGASRLEFEYEIPFEDAEELIKNFGTNVIEKTRHYITCDSKLWEVDEFKGLNAGLFIAEIELKSEDEMYNLPNWIGDNITTNAKYANSNLSLNPYENWKLS